METESDKYCPSEGDIIRTDCSGCGCDPSTDDERDTADHGLDWTCGDCVASVRLAVAL